MDMRAQKDAYLRRKGVKPPTPRTEPVYETPYRVSPGKRERRPSSDGEFLKACANKRKENLLSRARGGRPRNVDVAITSVLFAAKLKRLSLADSGSGEETSSDDRGLGERGRTVGKTWREKRKEAYLRTHNAPPPKEDAEVSPCSDRSSPSVTEEDGPSSSAAANAETNPSAPNKNREKSFAQKRKEAYLRRHVKPREADVAVSAVAFSSKVKRLSSSELDPNTSFGF